MASFFERGGLHGFRVWITLSNGSRKQVRYSGYKNITEAKKAANEIENQKYNNALVLPSKMTIEQFLRFWVDYKKEDLAPTTYESYNMIIERHLIPDLGNIEMQKVQPLHIQGYYKKALEKKLSPKTVKYHHRVLSMAFKYALNKDLIKRDIMVSVDPPKVKKKKIQPYSHENTGKLLELIMDNEKLEIPVNLAAGAGMRRGEILGLTWDKISFKDTTIIIDQQLLPTKQGLIFTPPKSEEGNRTIVISPTLINLLKRHKKRQAEKKLAFSEIYQDNNLVCCREDGQPIHPGTFSHWFSDFLSDNELPPIRFHDLRHYFVSMLLETNVPDDLIRQMVGHATSTFMKDQYGHLMDSGKKIVAQAVENKLYTPRK